MIPGLRQYQPRSKWQYVGGLYQNWLVQYYELIPLLIVLVAKKESQANMGLHNSKREIASGQSRLIAFSLD